MKLLLLNTRVCSVFTIVLWEFDYSLQRSCYLDVFSEPDVWIKMKCC